MTTINKSLAASGETLIYNHECELLWPFPVYNVYTYGNHGTVSANPNGGIEGTEVTLSNTPEAFYQFNGYTINGATLKNTNQFDINNSNVYVTGNFVSTLPEGVVCLYAHPDEVPAKNITGDFWLPALEMNVKTTGYNYYLVTYKEKFARSSNNDMPYGGFKVNTYDARFGFEIFYNSNPEVELSQYSGLHCVDDQVEKIDSFETTDSVISARDADMGCTYYYDNPAKPASSFITHSVINDAPLQQGVPVTDPSAYSANWSIYEDTTFVARTPRTIYSGFKDVNIWGEGDPHHSTFINYCPITARDFYIFACNTRQPLVNLLNQLS